MQGLTQKLSLLGQHVMDLLKAEFCRLATAITETLQLPQKQVTILNKLLDDQLVQISLASALPLPTQPLLSTMELAGPAATTIQAPPLSPAKDPRLWQTPAQMED